MAGSLLKCSLLFILVVLCADAVFGSGAITSDLWVNIFTPDNPPSVRHSHTAVFNPVNMTMVVFGGLSSTAIYNDVSTYGVDTDIWAAPAPTKGTPPVARYGHSAVVTGLVTMVVFGGRNDTVFFDDVAVFDLVASQWLKINTTGPRPPPRAYHTAVVDRYQHAMYVFGGVTPEGKVYNDLWVLDLDAFAWSRVVAGNATVTGRAYHSALMTQQGTMVVFGGMGLSDVVCFSVRNQSWYQCVDNKASPAPSVRYGHSVVFSPLQVMVVYGGKSGSGGYNGDIWNLDLSTFTWAPITPAGTPIAPRAFHSAVATSFGSMIIFGGIAIDNVISNDFGLYNLANTVLRSADDGAVLVVMVTLLGTILLILCFAMDYMNEQNEIERSEAIQKARNERKDADQLLIPKLPAIPKSLQIPLGPRAQKFFDEFKLSLDPMQEPPK